MKAPVVSLLLSVSLSVLVFLSASIISITRSTFSTPTSRTAGHHHNIDVCNFSTGHWILDTSRKPLYSSDCPFRRTAWNCGRNKKPEVEKISQWTWVPTNCSSWARTEPHSFLNTIRGMRLGFIGDSLNENFMVSLVCILRTADAKAHKWKKRGAWTGAHFPSYDVTVGYHRAVLLSKYKKENNREEELLGRVREKSGFQAHVDVPADDWSKAVQFYDVLVFNTGHWWGYDKFPAESPLVFYKQGQPIKPPLSNREGLAEVLKSMLDFIDAKVPAKTLKVWRLQSPRHFWGGEWNQRGSCSSSLILNSTQVDEWFDPANGGVNREEREVNQIIRSALKDRRDVFVLDVAHMSEFRADAHPSLWLGNKDAHLLWGQDCLHWCLPGLPDIWVDMLSSIIMHHIQASRRSASPNLRSCSSLFGGTFSGFSGDHFSL